MIRICFASKIVNRWLRNIIIRWRRWPNEVVVSCGWCAKVSYRWLTVTAGKYRGGCAIICIYFSSKKVNRWLRNIIIRLRRWPNEVVVSCGWCAKVSYRWLTAGRYRDNRAIGRICFILNDLFNFAGATLFLLKMIWSILIEKIFTSIYNNIL